VFVVVNDLVSEAIREQRRFLVPQGHFRWA